jgi:hypothetical protein
MIFTRSSDYQGEEVQMIEQAKMAYAILHRFKEYLPEADNLPFPFTGVLKIEQMKGQQDYVYNIPILDNPSIPEDVVVRFMRLFGCVSLDLKSESQTR